MPYEVAAHGGLYEAWRNRAGSRRIQDAGWSVRGFRHPDDVHTEFDSMDEVGMFNLTGKKVAGFIRCSETPAGDRVFWKKPTEDCVPHSAWESREGKLFPMFDDPRVGVLSPDRTAAIASVRDIPTTLEFPKFPKVGT